MAGRHRQAILGRRDVQPATKRPPEIARLAIAKPGRNFLYGQGGIAEQVLRKRAAHIRLNPAE